MLERLGEQLACNHLVAARYQDVCNLNERYHRNFPFADIAGSKGEAFYYFSVKTRNRFERTGNRNTGYHMTNVGAARRYSAEQGIVCMWIAVSVDTLRGVYSCYFGKLAELKGYPHGKPRIDMTVEAIQRYQAFAHDMPCPCDVSHLRNTLPLVRRDRTDRSDRVLRTTLKPPQANHLRRAG
jgi:hypothetical protein